MAFSTQKEFFHVPFMSELPDFNCPKVCVKLKSYPSTVDDRSWAADEDKKSRFVADLVSCNIPLNLQNDDDNGGPGGYGGPGGPGGPDDLGENGIAGDSLIIAAHDTIENMKNAMKKNNLLDRDQATPEDRKDRPRMENAELRRLMDERYDPGTSRVFRDKIQELSDSRKFDKSDERDLLNIHKAVDDMNKSHDILESQNSNLRRLIEKQSRRASIESIRIDPERSNDVNYLQNKINNMGKELIVLRQAEDEFQRSGGAKFGSWACSCDHQDPDTDIDDIQLILSERQALRMQIQELSPLNAKLKKQADYDVEEMARNFCAQNQYIADMENDIQEMQHYYEHEVEKSKYNEELLKCRCNELQQQVVGLQPAMHRSEVFQMEIDVLRNELRKRDLALNAYDCQYQQLMHKTKSFKKSGYRFLDELIESCSDSCFNEAGIEDDRDNTC
ncbi:GH22472 [Drosophila grimshawi]|uniref:GH22472 n=1 Tax=Drosophila grimshawi TaxID=7222 RepID=B4JSI4_DROGR|nr:GH22472 [Drosophila grimshawi]